MNEKNIQIKGILVLVILLGASLVTAFSLTSLDSRAYTYELKTFSSYDELLDYLSSNYDNYSDYGWSYKGAPSIFLSDSSRAESQNNGISLGGGSGDYSTTNVEVEGVDEPDIVKTDGIYIYIVSDSKIFIVKAYPTDEAVVLSEIHVESDVYLNNIFINEDRLVVFGTSSRYPVKDVESADLWWSGISTTVITIYDIVDRGNPKIVKDIEIDGWYFDSRMIGDYVYVIATEYSYDICPVFNGN